MKDKQLMDYLESDTEIALLVGERLWTTWLPEGSEYPAITCNYNSDNPNNTLGGEVAGREIITINIWAKSKQSKDDLFALVKARLNGYAVRQNKVPLDEPESGIYRYAVDYSVFG